jgi:hypothetical protein
MEASAPEPPSPFDGMTADELRAWILDEAESLITCDDISEAHRAWLKQFLSGYPDSLMSMAVPRDLLGPMYP